MHEIRGPLVVFSGGGTGGHLYPALAVADALRRRRPDVRVVFVGASRGVEARVLPDRGEDHVLLPVEGFRRRGGWRNWAVLPRLVASLVRTAHTLRSLRPEVVVVTGGYACGPAGLTAVLLRIPLVVQEQNSMPGLTTRVLSRWATQVHVAFPEALDRLPAGARTRARCTGNPVRPVAEPGREDAKSRLGLPREAFVVLVVGGSQGSAALNRVVLEAVRAVARGEAPRPAGLHLLWSTGPAHHDGIRKALEEVGRPDWVRAVAYIDEMPAVLASADLAISRAGAMATAELLAHGLPSILVPLPTAAADHQVRNARALEGAGAALVVEEGGLTGPTLWNRITGLATDDGARMRMSEAALARARPRAADEIALAIATLLPPAGEAA